MAGWLTAQPYAHRGLHDSAAGVIENTPSAFRAAFDAGYGIECDVQISADGEAMVHHDFILGRLTRGNSRLDERSAAYCNAILSLPAIAIILLLFIIASAWHMKIGMQVVIEDYIHNEKLKLASIMANNFFSIVVALASIYAIFKLSSGV